MKIILIIAVIISLAIFLQLPVFSAQPQEGRGHDGHFHGPDGSVQPDTCSTREGDEHPCECNRAKVCEGGGPNTKQEAGSKCKTFCRKDACSCVTVGCS
jgi:hypothetical protein